MLEYQRVEDKGGRDRNASLAVVIVTATIVMVYIALLLSDGALPPKRRPGDGLWYIWICLALLFLGWVVELTLLVIFRKRLFLDALICGWLTVGFVGLGIAQIVVGLFH